MAPKRGLRRAADETPPGGLDRHCPLVAPRQLRAVVTVALERIRSLFGVAGRNGGIAAVGTNRPSWQCVQRAHSARPMRCINSSIVAVTTGSGSGTDNACRASGSFVAFTAGASSLSWRICLKPLGVPARIVWTRFCNSGRLLHGISLTGFEG